MAVSRARQTKLRIRGHSSHVQAPTFGGFHPSEWPKRTATSGFCPPGARLAAFWGDFGLCVCTEKGSKMVKNGLKMTFSKNDTGPFGVSLEVFLARSEAPLSRFDLRCVVCFTYPQCAFESFLFCLDQVKRSGQKKGWAVLKKLKKPAAIPLQVCAHARQPHFASTIAFFMVDPPSASGPCLLRERGGSSFSEITLCSLHRNIAHCI